MDNQIGQIIAEINTENKNAKPKKPRTEKQMEAFRKCAEKRKQKLLDRKNIIASAPTDNTKFVSTSIETSLPIQTKPALLQQDDRYERLLAQMEMLQNHITGVNKRLESPALGSVNNIQTPPSVNNTSNIVMDADMMDDEDVNTYSHSNFSFSAPNIIPTPTSTPTFKNTNINRPLLGQGLGYNITSQIQNTASRKRDVRGMDPYADEKQGMMEKIYARQTNQYKQQMMEQERRKIMADENSIQILNGDSQMQIDSSSSNANTYHRNTDRFAPVEQMSTMIKSASNTIQARRNNAVAFNGLRMASRFR